MVALRTTPKAITPTDRPTEKGHDLGSYDSATFVSDLVFAISPTSQHRHPLAAGDYTSASYDATRVRSSPYRL